MNNKGHLKKSYIVLIVILIISVIGIIMLLEYAKDMRVNEPLKNNETTITTVTNKVTTQTTTSNVAPSTTTSKVDVDEEVVNVENFSASLEKIIAGRDIYGDFELSISYSGAKFSFNCTEYSEETKKCLKGSGLMNTGTTLLPLFTYEQDEDNYLLRQKDFYIIVNNENILLVTNYVGKSVGNIKIYDKSGKFLNQIDNVITGYIFNNKLATKLYPSIEQNTLYYYACDNNAVKIASINIPNLNDFKYEEQVENARCY